MKTDLLNQSTFRRSFAEYIGKTVGAVNQWAKGVRPWPAERCIQLEKFTDGAVRCEELRPDVDWAYLRGTTKISSE